MQPSGLGPLMYSSRHGAQRRSSATRGTVAAGKRSSVYPQGVRLLPRRGPKIEQLKQTGDVDGLRKALDHQSADDGDGTWALNPAARAEAAAALATFDGAVVEDGL